MKQLQLFGANDLRLVEVAAPQCGADDVIVDVAACGICGSDLGYVGSGGLGAPQPMPLGHEFAGRISAVGSAVAQWQVGQAVVVNPLSAANLIGNGGSDGAFARQVRVRQAQTPGTLFALPPGLGLERAALAEPLAVAFHAVAQGAAHAATRAVVLGAGPIGLGCVIGLARLGASDIVVLDRSARRRALALELGADAVFGDGDEAFWQALVERHGGSDFYGRALPRTELFIDCAGAAALVQAVVQHAAPRTRVVVVAVHHHAAALDLTLVMAKELEVGGAFSYGESFPDAIAHLAANGERLAPYVSHRLPLSRFDAAFALAADAEQAAKVLVVPD